jgi:hypothetical protein
LLVAGVLLGYKTGLYALREFVSSSVLIINNQDTEVRRCGVRRREISLSIVHVLVIVGRSSVPTKIFVYLTKHCLVCDDAPVLCLLSIKSREIQKHV